uniref:Sigma factor sigB regulation protein rsbQ n=1 Tax=Anthurium amnicola TaxID=1678845 RepID=A0A1D1Z9Q9_9ARAE
MGNDGRKLLEILNVRVVGSGEKVLVLSHGFGTDQSAWQRVLPYFTRDHRVVLYDLVCAGSVNPDHFDFHRYTTLDAYVDDLLSILDALRVDRCAFVGHSVSAMIGILAAIRRPALFTKLVLLGASPRYATQINPNPPHPDPDPRTLFASNQVPERQGLPRRVRDRGDREGVRGDGVQLRGVGEGVRAAVGGGGRAGGCEGVQPDAVQHEAGHLAVRVEDGVPQRPARGAGTRPHPLLHRPGRQGRLRPRLRRRLPQVPPRRPHLRRDPPGRGPPPPPLRPRPPRPRPPPGALPPVTPPDPGVEPAPTLRRYPTKVRIWFLTSFDWRVATRWPVAVSLSFFLSFFYNTVPCMREDGAMRSVAV